MPHRNVMSRKKTRAAWPVILLIIAFLCPTEFSLYLAGLRLPPHRVALLIIMPLALWRLLAQKGLKFRSFDLAFVLFNVWTIAIYMYHQGQDEGLVYGGSLALESLGSYLVARVWIRNSEQFMATLRVMAAAIMAAALIALPETLFGQIFTHDILKTLTGYAHPVAVETRLHLTRAYGTFDHPIHYGTFCAALLAMFWYSEQHASTRYKAVAMVTIATLLGLSSAPILCLGLQAFMLLWEHQTRHIKSRTGISLAILAGLYIGASFVMTRSPVNFIATGMTLDPWTGYYRLQIWENGLNNVYGDPWTGIGLKEWVRPWWMVSPTVDAFWLVTLMREGVPAALLLVSGIVLLARSVTRRGMANSDFLVRRLARGWMMSLIALCLVGTTVHFWNVLHAFLFFFLGLAGWMADPRRAPSRVSKAQQAARYRVHTLGPLPVAPAQPQHWPPPYYPAGATA